MLVYKATTLSMEHAGVVIVLSPIFCRLTKKRSLFTVHRPKLLKLLHKRVQNRMHVINIVRADEPTRQPMTTHDDQ